MIPYKVQMLQNLNDFDNEKCFEYCADMQLCFVNDSFANHLIFIDEATFHVSGKVH